MKKQIANILTGFRILGSIALLFCPVFSAHFYVLYLFCGLTDMIDGTVARWTQSASLFGSRLDTAADLAFTAVSLLKILPVIQLEKWLWIWGGAIAAIKIGCQILGMVRFKRMISLHTISSKMTGLLLFLLPFSLPYIDLQYSASLVCGLATASAIQEGYYLKMGCDII